MMPTFKVAGERSVREHALDAVALGARTIRQVRAHIRQQGRTVSNQAVWKALQGLVSAGVLASEKIEGEWTRYVLSEAYLRQLGRFVDEARRHAQPLRQQVNAGAEGEGIVCGPGQMVGREVRARPERGGAPIP